MGTRKTLCFASMAAIAAVAIVSMTSSAFAAPVTVLETQLQQEQHDQGFRHLISTRADPEPQEPPSKSDNPDNTITAPKDPAGAPVPAKIKEKKYTFEILNPAPNDIWTSGSIETLSWVDSDLPPRATFDITLVPVDPETNPQALILSRRPFLRYVRTTLRFLDMVVPYDLITKEQLVKEQEGDGEYVEQPNEEYINGIHQGIGKDVVTLTIPTSLPVSTAPPAKDIQSQARLFITAYDGRTDKILVQKSVFPIIIKKDHERDRRVIPAPPPALDNLTPVVADEEDRLQDDQETDYSDDDLDKEDSEMTHMENGSSKDSGEEDTNIEDHQHYHAKDIVEGDDGGDEALGEGDTDSNNSDDPETESTESDTEEDQQNMDGIEVENEPDVTPTGDEQEESEDMPMENMNDNEHEHGHEHSHGEGEGEGEEEEEEEEEHEHGHSHFSDPNHFQNDDDIELWEEHMDDPGYNPPIKVIEAGEISITRWIDNKVRFYVGAPYVFAWEFPKSGKDLTGTVNVYVEDAFTGKRYDIVAGNLPSDILFMYLQPSAIMMSASPNRRIYLRARVEMDLFKNGNIHRYTGFSRMFWVERGAL